MDINTMLQDPILTGTLANVTASAICKVASIFNKKPRLKSVTLELEHFIQRTNFDEYVTQNLFDFINKDEVQNHFYNYVNYRTIRLSDDTTARKITREEFISTLAKTSCEYMESQECLSYEMDSVHSFFNEIVNQIEEKIINKISDEQRYLFNILTNIELLLTDINTKNGLTVSNENEKEYESTIKNYIKILKSNHKDAHIYGVDIVKLDKFYVFPNLKIAKNEVYYDFKRLPSWRKVFQYSNIVSIIGGPGYGKTTFIKCMILNYEMLDIYNADKLVPIYCDLKNYYDFKGNSQVYSIEDFIVQSMIEETNLNSKELNLDLLRYYLIRGRCIVFFDALDEVPKEKRDDLQKKIVTFFQTLNQNNKIVITSRDRAFIPRTEYIIRIAELDKKQVKEYLVKMSTIDNCNISKRDIQPFLKQAEPLIENGFLTSFLLLSLLVNVYRSEQELPSTKTKLYKKCIEHIVRQRERKDKKTKFNFEQFNYILQNDFTFEELARLGSPNNQNVDTIVVLENLSNKFSLKYGSYISAYNAVEEFLKFCGERTDFYVKGTKDNSYRFFHRSFFDYYLSRYLNRYYVNNNELLKEIVTLPKDSEVFEILIQLLIEENYPRYIELVELMFKNVTKYLNNTGSFSVDYIKDNWNVLTLMMINITEISYANKYVELLFNEALKYDLDFDIGKLIYNIALRNNVWGEFSERLIIEYPVKLCGAIIIRNLWRYCNQHNRHLFEFISYSLFDSFFVFVSYINKSSGTLHLPRYEEVKNYLSPKINKFEQIEYLIKDVYGKLGSYIEINNNYHDEQFLNEVFKTNFDISLVPLRE